jgi:adenylate cyclase
MKDQKTRRLAAIMFTDIVGYTALMQQNEAMAAKVRNRHRAVFDNQHELYNGEILQYFGDGTLSVFQSGVEAVECAIAIQKRLTKEDPVPLRIGLHMGDFVFDGTEIYGDSVNVSSRIESMGIPGAVLLPGKLNDELKNHNQITTTSLGLFDFKNVAHPLEIFAVTNDGIEVPESSQLKGKGKQAKQNKTIAVLPFVNMSSSEENEYFSDGMTEEIINALAKIKELKVTSRTSSFFFKNKNIPVPQIGQELNVSTILEGSIRLSGNKVRITAQLIDVEEDFHFWSETFDRSMENIFAVQDEISLLIADKLREHLGHFDIGDHLVNAPEIPVEIYKKYLEGRYYLNKLNVPGTQKGISILKEVIAAQPNFPLPYLNINQGYAFLGTMGLIPAMEAFTEAKPYLDKAIELDENLPESQLNLAWICCWQNWDLVGTYRHLNKALDIRPADHIYLTMANTLVLEGKFKAALNYMDKAMQLDPFAAMNHHFVGFIYFLQEKHEKAIVSFKKSISLQANLSFPLLYWGESLLLLGRGEEGLAHFQNLPALGLGDLSELGGTTMAYATLGNKYKAEEGISKLEALLETDSMGSAINFLILGQTMLGKYEKAIKLIEQGIAYRLPMMLLLNTDPILKPLRKIPRFQELMQELFGKEHAPDFSKKKYKRSSLKQTAAEKYYTQLETYMSDEKPFLQANLTLRQLAEMINIHPNSLSELLNEKVGKNFSEYINHYRVETFKEIATTPKNAHLSLLGLAYESGFNSKTAFNSFFKKETGMTPNQYLKSVV